MTDCRVTDLSYGHPGLASYDGQRKLWNFSTCYEEDLLIEQVEPLKECMPSSLENMPVDNEIKSVIAKSQSRRLLKILPELHATRQIIYSLISSNCSDYQPLNTGSLLAVGHALDTKSFTGTRRPLIIASTTGGAADILQILRPRQETRGWGNGIKSKLSLLSNKISEIAYWTNTAGTIRQVAFSDTETKVSTWLATRQDSTITIFRPYYGHTSSKSKTINFSQNQFPPSPLHVNPVATVSCKENSSLSYSDTSFNPWNPRQFATINSLGHWTVYDLKRSHRSNPSERVLQRNTGDIYDDNTSATASLLKSSMVDGWHRILWVCDSSTIVICNRSYIAIFDIKSKPVRLQIPNLVSIEGTEIILDITRSLSNSTQLFIMTSSRVFWVQVTSFKPIASDQKDASAGGKIILSHRHFRSPCDESLRLVPVKSEKVSLLLISAKHPLIGAYFFGEKTGESSSPYTLQGSFNLSCLPEQTYFAISAFLIPCEFILHLGSDNVSDLKAQYYKDVEFYQLWSVTPTLQILSTLCAIRRVDHEELLLPLLKVTAPDRKLRNCSYRMARQVSEDSFIAPEGPFYDDYLVKIPQNYPKNSLDLKGRDQNDDLRLRLDWKMIFQNVYSINYEGDPTNLNSPEIKAQNTLHYLSIVSSRIKDKIEEGRNSIISIYEICDLDPVSEDLSYVENVLQNFLSSFPLETEINCSNSRALNEISLLSDVGLSLELGTAPNLTHIFDKLLEIWLTSLPQQVSNCFRGARFRIIRKLALDIYLSSFGISLRMKKPSNETQETVVLEVDKNINSQNSLFSLDTESTSTQGDNRHMENIPSSSIHTQSIQSDNNSSELLQEDPSISRLRRYAISINSRSVFDRPSFLNDWPSEPGSDPDIYSYEAVIKTTTQAESGEENCREKSRKQWRTRRHISQQSPKAVGPAPAVVNTSQHAESMKQIPKEIPNKQSNKTVFGGIGADRNKKPKKPRRAGF